MKKEYVEVTNHNHQWELDLRQVDLAGTVSCGGLSFAGMNS